MFSAVHHFSCSKKPTVSVLVTAYNHGQYVAAAIESIFQQSFLVDEIIFIDAGSSDNTVDEVKKIRNRNISLYVYPGVGPSQAINLAIKKSSSEILVFLSADDQLTKFSIELRVEAINSDGKSIVGSRPLLIGPTGDPIDNNEYPDIFRSFTGLSARQLYSNLYFEGNFICASSIAMSRKCVEKVGFFNPNLIQLQDYEYWLRAAGLEIEISCLDYPCVSYRWHGNNLSLNDKVRSSYELESVLLSAPRFATYDVLFYSLFKQDPYIGHSKLIHQDLETLIKAAHSNPLVNNFGLGQLRLLLEDNLSCCRIQSAIF